MTGPSDWPLPPDGVRFFVPSFLRARLAEHALTRDLYPHALGYYPTAHGHRVVRTDHGDDLLLYCVDGGGWLEVEGVRWPVREGDLMMLPVGFEHAYGADDTHPWTLYWVHFSGGLAPRFWAEMGFRRERPVSAVGSVPKLVADFEALMGVRRSGYALPVFVHAANHLREMLSYLAVLSPKSEMRRAGQFDLDYVHALMQEHVCDHLDLDGLAERLRLSKYSFARKYKQLTGTSPIQSFIQMKMERACYLLDLGGRNVQRVAWELGYTDPYYFSRLFRKIIGMSPTAYRAMRHG
ncbi:MAG TPA: AraC family transcriptional regulator [Gammaproteobacteria bacterium]|nr:AraC family transcriptional regulator [Gammaproteobacteria bacterium]